MPIKIVLDLPNEFAWPAACAFCGSAIDDRSASVTSKGEDTVAIPIVVPGIFFAVWSKTPSLEIEYPVCLKCNAAIRADHARCVNSLRWLVISMVITVAVIFAIAIRGVQPPLLLAILLAIEAVAWTNFYKSSEKKPVMIEQVSANAVRLKFFNHRYARAFVSMNRPRARAAS